MQSCAGQIFAHFTFSSTSELSELIANNDSAGSLCAQHKRSFDLNDPIKEDEILVVSEMEGNEVVMTTFEDTKLQVCQRRRLKRQFSAPALIDSRGPHLPGMH